MKIVKNFRGSTCKKNPIGHEGNSKCVYGSFHQGVQSSAQRNVKNFEPTVEFIQKFAHHHYFLQVIFLKGWFFCLSNSERFFKKWYFCCMQLFDPKHPEAPRPWQNIKKWNKKIIIEFALNFSERSAKIWFLSMQLFHHRQNACNSIQTQMCQLEQ